MIRDYPARRLVTEGPVRGRRQGRKGRGEREGAIGGLVVGEEREENGLGGHEERKGGREVRSESCGQERMEREGEEGEGKLG